MEAMALGSALLIMDVQRGIVERFGAPAEDLTRLAAAAGAARAAGVAVIHVRVAFRPGHPEVSPRNRAFAALRAGGAFADAAAASIHPAVGPGLDEVVVTKLRVSAFAGSDLEVILRAQGIEELVLAGIATSGVVLSTLREAADRDYRLAVLEDACLDADAEVHRVLMQKVFPRQAEVLTVAAWRSRLAPPAG